MLQLNYSEIDKLILSKEVTVQEFCQAIKVSKVTYYNWIKRSNRNDDASNRISLSIISRMANFFQVHPYVLMLSIVNGFQRTKDYTDEVKDFSRQEYVVSLNLAEIRNKRAKKTSKTHNVEYLNVFCEQIGITRKTYYNWTKDTTSTTLDSISKISKALKCEACELDLVYIKIQKKK